VGCVVIAAVVLLGSELLVFRGWLAPTDPKMRIAYLVRGVVASGLIAVFSGWFVDRARQRFEHAREALRDEQARLAESARRMEQAAGLAATLRIMGHEIRNPLHGMALQCRIIERSVDRMPAPVAEQVRDSVMVLDGEVRRVSSLLDEYMAHGRADRISLSQEPVDLASVVDEVVALHRAELDERNLAIDVKVPKDLPRIVGDERKLAQVVHNLVRNSIDAVKPQGHIEIAACQDGGSLVLSVSDDGPGFVEPEAAFRPFYSTKPAAAGLGLAVVRDIVRAHRGDTHASNGKGGGARVEIRLPAKVAA